MNPRYTFVGIHTISSRAPSAARTSLREKLILLSANEQYNVLKSWIPSFVTQRSSTTGMTAIKLQPKYIMAERGGFEPPWELVAPKSISSRSRYDHFGTSPRLVKSPKRWGCYSLLLKKSTDNFPAFFW